MTDRASAWAVIKPKTALRRLGNGGGAVPIKSQASPIPKEGLVPAFSASGQDVWLPHATHFGDALILSAVGARCGKVFRAKGRWALVANTTPLGVSAGHSPDFWFYRCNAEGWWLREGSAQPFVRVRPTLDRAEPTPALEEQGLIVRYLDYAELRIAKAIAAKQQVLQLLRERQKQVAQAVVLGLPLGVKTVESGEKWIGEVPAHWELRRMKSWFIERSVKNCPQLPLLAATQSRGVVTKEDYGLRTVVAQTGLENLKVVEPGDFVISLRSFEGGVEVSYAKGIISPAYTVLRPIDNTMTPYFTYLLKTPAFIDALRMSVTGIREGQNINYARLSRCLVPMPPPEERAVMVARLREVLSGGEMAIKAINDEIALLKEYRTRLISDVVTGKLDVRDEAAKLPEIDPMELATVAVSENGDDEEATDDD